MIWLKQNTAVVISFGPFVDKTDGVTPETGLVASLDHASTGIMLSKNGGAFAVRHAAVTATTYDAYGNYRVTLDATDTNTLGTLRVQFIETATCLPVWADAMVIPAQVWDSLFGADTLQVHAIEISNNLITAAAINADAITAAKIADGAIDAATFAAGAINAAAIAADAITAAKVADGTIDAATFAAGAINAAAIAADAITDAKVAADVTIASVTGAVGSVTGLTPATVHADLDDIQARLPAALTANGNIKADALRVGGTVQTGGDLAAMVDATPTNAELATALAAADDAVLAAIAALNNLSAAQVNAEVVDALNIDAYAEPGQGTPAAALSLAGKISFLYKAWRNKKDQTGGLFQLYGDDALTVHQKATVSDDGTTATRGEIASGP